MDEEEVDPSDPDDDIDDDGTAITLSKYFKVRLQITCVPSSIHRGRASVPAKAER